jgi:hypothetical protein
MLRIEDAQRLHQVKPPALPRFIWIPNRQHEPSSARLAVARSVACRPAIDHKWIPGRDAGRPGEAWKRSSELLDARFKGAFRHGASWCMLAFDLYLNGQPSASFGEAPRRRPDRQVAISKLGSRLLALRAPWPSWAFCTGA